MRKLYHNYTIPTKIDKDPFYAPRYRLYWRSRWLAYVGFSDYTPQPNDCFLEYLNHRNLEYVLHSQIVMIMVDPTHESQIETHVLVETEELNFLEFSLWCDRTEGRHWEHFPMEYSIED